MAWKTIAYRIEECYIPDGYKMVRTFFLDAVQVDEKTGRKSTTNICSGTRDYCLATLNGFLPVVESVKTNRQIESEISE